MVVHIMQEMSIGNFAQLSCTLLNERKTTWGPETATDFIESLSVDLPAQTIVIAHVQENNSFTVLDGEQRRNALRDFISSQYFASLSKEAKNNFLKIKLPVFRYIIKTKAELKHLELLIDSWNINRI